MMDMAAKHVLVAGGSGVVGRAALDAFGGAGWEITTLSRNASGPGSPRHVSADLLDSAAWRRAPRRSRRAGFAAMNERADEVLLAHLEDMRARRLIP